MDVQTNGGADFKALGAKFRAAGKNGAAVRKATTSFIQAKLKVIVEEQQRDARSMKVKGTRGGGARRRQAVDAAAIARAAAKGRKARARRGGYGLRAMTAAAIKSKVSYSGRKLGARITVDTSKFPASQKSLPRHLDSPKGWRHPVFANRAKWVAQKGEPYFTWPIKRHAGTIRRDVSAAVNAVMRTLK